jgi:hypothetical protein
MPQASPYRRQRSITSFGKFSVRSASDVTTWRGHEPHHRPHVIRALGCRLKLLLLAKLGEADIQKPLATLALL